MAKLRAKIFTERLHKGYAQSMEITAVLAEERSRYQQIKIFDTVANGRVMVLDDIVQITTRDESAYAEMLTHLPLLEHGSATRVMIVGGGDLSIADEALKHKSVKEVVLVDIDGRVVELCREHFGAINAKAFKDKRLKIEIADAFEYLGRRSQSALRSHRRRPPRSGGARQGVVRRHFLRARARRAASRRLRHLPDRRAVLPALGDHRGAERACRLFSAIGSLPHRGADLYRRLHGALLGGHGQASGHAGRHQARAARFAAAKLKTDYYNPDIHAAAFAFPEWIKRLVPKKRGR